MPPPREPSGFKPLTRWLIAALIAVCIVGAQAEGASPSPSPAPAASATPSPTPIPLASVVSSAETVAQQFQQIQSEAATSPTTEDIARELKTLTEQIDAHQEETEGTLRKGAPLDALRDMEARWGSIKNKLGVWSQELTVHAGQVDNSIAQLPEEEATWKATLALAKSSAAPAEVTQRATGVLQQIHDTGATLQKMRAAILTLQDQVAVQMQRASSEVKAVQAAESAVVSGLWVQDSPPIWDATVGAAARRDLMQNGKASMGAQGTHLRTYLARQWTKLIYFLLILATLAFLLAKALAAVEKQASGWAEEDPALGQANRLLKRPIATGSVLAFLLFPFLFPDAPRLFWVLSEVIALVPIVILLRRVIDRHLFPILNAVVVFYILDQIRALASALPILSRVILMLEALAGITFVIWFIRSTRSRELGPVARRATMAGARAGLVLLAVVLISDLLGYVGLASYLGTGTLAGAYRAVVLYAATNVSKGLIFFALQLWPLASFTVVRRHRPLLRQRIGRVLSIIATVIWVLSTLEALSLRRVVVGWVMAVLNAKYSLGTIDLSLGGVIAFGLTIWFTVMLSRFVRFILVEDVYDRLRLAPGSSYAFSTILHYVILLVGFLVALSAIGVDMTKVTILAGAFGVGIGFGLQNIFNNFFSGIILLLERPIRIGDVIDVSGASGVVMQIGIRASKLRQVDNSVLIVPNGLLISGTVTNRNAPSQQAQIEFLVRTAYESDPAKVIELLTAVAVAHPLVAKNPAPDVFMKEFGQWALVFDLICFTDDPAKAPRTQSDLAVAAANALRNAGIGSPSKEQCA